MFYLYGYVVSLVIFTYIFSEKDVAEEISYVNIKNKTIIIVVCLVSLMSWINIIRIAFDYVVNHKKNKINRKEKIKQLVEVLKKLDILIK